MHRTLINLRTIVNRGSKPQIGRLTGPRKAKMSSSTTPGLDWEERWRKGVPKGDRFDVGSISPTLLNALQRLPTPAPGATALIPGAGRAYDSIALVKHGFDRVVAVDISETACEAARKELRESNDASAEKIRIVHDDFFQYKHDPFDLVWDCTFLCAIDPSMRLGWAKKTAELVKNDGKLITCIFPIYPTEQEGGPPFPMTVDLVRGLVEPAGFKAEVVDEKLPKEALHLPDRLSSSPTTALGIWTKS